MEKVYILIHTYGDYIGWFESEVIAVSKDRELLQNRLDNIPPKQRQTNYTDIWEIQESELT